MIVNTESDYSLRGDMQQRILPGMSKAEQSLVAANLDWLMQRKGTNANALAGELSRLGAPLPQPTIFRILTGETKDPRTSSLQPLADYFGVTVAALRDHDFKTHGMPGSPGTTLKQSPKIRTLVSVEEANEPIGEIPYWDAKGSCGGVR